MNSTLFRGQRKREVRKWNVKEKKVSTQIVTGNVTKIQMYQIRIRKVKIVLDTQEI